MALGKIRSIDCVAPLRVWHHNAGSCLALWVRCACWHDNYKGQGENGVTTRDGRIKSPVFGWDGKCTKNALKWAKILNSSSFSPFETHTHRNRHHYQQKPAELMISRNNDGSCSRHLARLAFSWGKMVNFGTRSQSQKLKLHLFFSLLARGGKCKSIVKFSFQNKQREVQPT